MKNKIILLISPEAWGKSFVSKHHYASYLSKNNTVCFLNPVKGAKINAFGNVGVQTKKINNNLIEVSYENLVPRLNKLNKKVQNFFYKKLSRILKMSVSIAL